LARTFLTNLNLNGNEIQNVRVQQLASDPGSPAEGQIWENTTSKLLKVYLNGVTISLGRLDQITAPGAAVSFNGQQITNVLAELLSSDPGSPDDGRFWVNTTTDVFKVRAGGVTYVLGRLDQINPPTADVSLNNHKITSLADGTAPTDGATVGQVNAARSGLDFKNSCRVASTADVDIASPGAAIDGVTLATGDRVLLKNQTDACENGIYVFDTDTTPLVRATDADSNAEVTSGLTTWVDEGSVNANTGWVLVTADPLVLGTDDLEFTKYAAAPIPSGISKYATSVGNGSATSIAVTHNLGTTDVVVQVFNISTGAQVEPDVTITDSNNVTLGFTVAPTTNQYRCIVIG